MATFAMSLYFAMNTGYTYGPQISLANYTTLAKGLGAVLAAGVLLLIVVTHSLRIEEGQLEQRLMRWLESKGEWVGREWDDEMERAVEEKVELEEDEATGIALWETLADKGTAARLRRYSARLLAIPVTALAIIVAISLWAVPASGAFLQGQSELNTTLIFVTSYGTLVALGLFFAGLVTVLKE